MKYISTNGAPAAVGPYSQAIVSGNYLYASGQVGFIPSTGALAEGGIVGQAEQVMKNIDAILTAAGTDYKHVVKTTCFLNDINDFATFNEVYAKYFSDHKPARSCFAVEALPKGALVEVELIAELS